MTEAEIWVSPRSFIWVTFSHTPWAALGCDLPGLCSHSQGDRTGEEQNRCSPGSGRGQAPTGVQGMGGQRSCDKNAANTFMIQKYLLLTFKNNLFLKVLDL